MMFDKILIANRGEIACRIIRTARAMGVQTVAVYSDADANALHVRQADQAVRIGPAPVADSYLRGDVMIAAALATGAQAIHPGYGFLSETPDFVEAVEAAGLVFIGPSAAAIRAMGLKDAAKALMTKAGVPVVAGYQGANQRVRHLASEAVKIGYPVLIKAVAGGGGKGMRLVTQAADFVEALGSARAEARTAFGNADVLIEKYIASPRHIEVQVFGDGTDVVHLFERDCSLQRRHQKVIEEAPAPGMTVEMRKAMGNAAVKAAKAIGYKGAGTVEFIVDASDGLREDRFWFMEMNTRLQVEHPVTEAITGVDLVAWQLQVAAGGRLPLSQDQLQMSGHSFEARIYAEDVPAGFLPATGALRLVVFPNAARIDSGVESGSEISPWYDPMIAKLIVHGADRAEALGKLRSALAAVQIAGVATNTNFLRKLAAHARFSQGLVDTGVIARDSAQLCEVPAPQPIDIGVAAIIASVLTPPFDAQAGFALWQAIGQIVPVLHADLRYDVTLQIVGSDQIAVGIADQKIFLRGSADGWVSATERRSAIRHGNQVTVFGPQDYQFTLVDPLDRSGAELGGNEIVAPMPGLIHAVSVALGDRVAEGQRLLALEAMKMEHILRAPRDGIIGALLTATGDQVTAGQLLVVLEAES